MNKKRNRDLLLENGFSLPVYVKGLKTIAHLFEEFNNPGIYVLHFSDNTKYVGQSKNIANRFNQHSNNFDDIDAISIKKVKLKELNKEEKFVIWLLESNKILLRNITYASETTNSGVLIQQITEKEQEKWLRQVNYNSYEGIRLEDEKQKLKYEKKYLCLSRSKYFEDTIRFLKSYIDIGIPFPIKTEKKYWIVSCLPSGATGVLVRLSINWQEVLTIFKEEETIGVSIHMANPNLNRNLIKKFKELGVQCSEHRYVPGGEDQINLYVYSFDNALKFINIEEVILSIRKFNLNLMRKGICTYSRYHCLQIVDYILKI